MVGRHHSTNAAEAFFLPPVSSAAASQGPNRRRLCRSSSRKTDLSQRDLLGKPCSEISFYSPFLGAGSMKVPLTLKTTLRFCSYPAVGTSAGKDLLQTHENTLPRPPIGPTWPYKTCQGHAVGGAVCCRLSLPSLHLFRFIEGRDMCLTDLDPFAKRVACSRQTRFPHAKRGGV